MLNEESVPLSEGEARSSKFREDQRLELRGRLRHPETSREALVTLTKRNNLPQNILSLIPDSPLCDEEILRILSQKTLHVWTIRGMTNRFKKIHSSYLNSLEEREPFSQQMISSRFENSSLAAAHFLWTGTAFSEYFWHDLATNEILRIDYRADTAEGDHFGPLYDDKFPEFDNSLTEWILSDSENCDWIRLDTQVDIDFVVERLVGDEIVGAYLESQEYRSVDRVTKDAEAMALATAHGLENGHLESVDSGILETLMAEWLSDFDRELVDSEVAIISEPKLSGLRFRDLSETQVENVVFNLLEANKHFLMQRLGIASHLLSLVVLHENTPAHLKNQILSSSEVSDNFAAIREYLES